MATKLFDDDKTDVLHHEDLQDSDSFSDDDAIEDTNPGKAVWLICMTASMGGFLFGMAFLLFSLFQ